MTSLLRSISSEYKVIFGENICRLQNVQTTRLSPRAMAIAETAWTQNANKDWKNFCERMVTEFERLKVMNTNLVSTSMT